MIRHLAVILCLLPRTLPAQELAAPETAPDFVWQTVQEYFSHAPPGERPVYVSGTRRVNSFVHYTHIGTDFGFHGPAAFEVVWRENVVNANLRQHPDRWAGMWHSLAGLAREQGRVLNFTAPYAPWVSSACQPRIEALQVIAAGPGILKLEIQDAQQKTLWLQMLPLPDDTFHTVIVPLPADELRACKFLNWTAEPRSDISLNRLSLGFRMPASMPDLYAFHASYAKLARGFEGGCGLMRDRSHTEPGAFDSVPATGLFALATAAAATPELGLVSREHARTLIHEVVDQVGRLEAPLGLLPHFVRFENGAYRLHPGTEYSTVDTAIYYHAVLLASRLIADAELEARLLQAIQKIEFPRLHLEDGSITHGLKSDGANLLPHGWSDWGGETALVLLLRQIADPLAAPSTHIAHPGEVWQGTGFIAELQSLFYPDFDADTPDLLQQVSWHASRLWHLERQQNYIRQRWRGTLADEIGLYGLSAGENAAGTGYQVSGTSLSAQNLLHPHYFLMSACLRPNTKEVLDIIDNLRRIGFMPPFGMVENVTVTGSSYLPMNGSLNAGFEAISAYHLLCRSRQLPNRLYEASMTSPELRQAIQIYYKTSAGANAGP